MMARWEGWLLACIGIAAVISSLIATRDGVGIDADSAVYLGTAQNIIDGRGETVPFTLFTDTYDARDADAFDGRVPLTHFPPLYPAMVAGIAAPGLSVEQAARLLGALLLGFNLVLVGWLAADLVPNVVVRIVTVILAGIGPVAGDVLLVHGGRTWLFQHGQAMSEGLFTSFALLTLVALRRYMRRQDTGSLVFVAASAALALATRYAGLALVATAAIVVWRSTDDAVARRARRCAAVTVAALSPTMLWQAGVAVLEHASGARSLHWPNRGPSNLAGVFEGWFGLSHWPSTPRHLGLTAIIVMTVVAARRARNHALTALATYLALYTLVVVTTRAFIDASTPTDDRMFSPLQGPTYLLVFGAIGTAMTTTVAWRLTTRGLLRAVGLGIPIGLLLASVHDARLAIERGFPPRPSPPSTVAAVTLLPRDAVIATNVPTQIWEATRRSSMLVPLRVTTVTDEANGAFARQVRELVTVIVRRHGYIVLLGPALGGFGTIRQANESDFEPFRYLQVVRRLRDGVILGVRDTSS